MVKHLPPSASSLRLIEMCGALSIGELMRELRPDLELVPAERDPTAWRFEADWADAVAVFDIPLTADLLAAGLRTLRPGGRLIAILPDAKPDAEYVRILEATGYTRILVEAAVGSAGALVRGEKPHLTMDTHARVRLAADRDVGGTIFAPVDWTVFRGRFVHLLIEQTPHKPVWALNAGEQVSWRALAVEEGGAPAALGFSSLPKAVAFMQRAILSGALGGVTVHRIVKFSTETAAAWPFVVWLNPPADVLNGRSTALLPVDPASAEAPDE